MNKLPQLILVTGFLGAGKTTLLNRLISHYSSKKLGVIINDFGQLAVDGLLINETVKNSGHNESHIYEIANGSIFCSCLSAELVKALKYYVEIQPDVVLIETSGLSDPSTFGKILTENRLDLAYNIAASFCVVDPTKTMRLAQQIVSIEKQITSSSTIIVNKIDLITSEEYDEIVKFIRSLNKTAHIIKSINADIDLSLLNNRFVEQPNPAPVTCNTVGSRPGSILLEQIDISAELLQEFYTMVKDKIFRIKGFLQISDELFYVSDSNEQLLIERTREVVKHLGLSVLAPSANESFVIQAWIDMKTQASNPQ